MKTLTLRRRLVLAALGTVGIALGMITLGYNLVLAGRLNADADHLLASRAQAQLANLKVVRGRLRLAEAPGDAVLDDRIWVFTADHHVLERPLAPPGLHRAADQLSRGLITSPAEIADDRLLAVQVRRQGRVRGTVISAASLAPYERSAHVALIASLVLDAVLLAAVALLARRTATVALRPVARMTNAALDWSDHDLDRRFDLGTPRDELSSLGATLDSLLARLAASLRHEQRLVAELSHELRTPLAALRAEAELALRRKRSPDQLTEALQAILAQAGRMDSVVEALMTGAEHEAGFRGSVSARTAASAALDRVHETAERRGVRLSLVRGTADATVAADAELAAQILGPVLDNAIRYGRSFVELSTERHNGSVLFKVHDDGPGIRQDELERIFEPGTRGAAGGARRGAGLGLPLARRLARTAGGDVLAAASASGGRFVVRLPGG